MKNSTNRQKLAEQKTKTIEKMYGKDFAVKGEMSFEEFCKKNNYNSLYKLLQK